MNNQFNRADLGYTTSLISIFGRIKERLFNIFNEMGHFDDRVCYVNQVLNTHLKRAKNTRNHDELELLVNRLERAKEQGFGDSIDLDYFYQELDELKKNL